MKRGSILGVIGLCALALAAVGAADASAAKKGLTAVTCEEKGVGSKYNSSECSTPAVKGEWETTQVPLNTATETGGSAVGTSVWKFVVALTSLEVKCGKVTTTGSVKNIEKEEEVEAGKKEKVMEIEGTNIVSDYTECKAGLQANPAKKCEIESLTGTKGVKGTFATNSMKSITGFDEKHQVTYSPTTAGGNFFEFNILKGECLGATAKVTVTGALIGIANTEKHNHVTFTPATNGTGLKANGGAASFEGTTSGTMKGTTNLLGAETF
jgi:hypothetical protein